MRQRRCRGRCRSCGAAHRRRCGACRCRRRARRTCARASTRRTAAAVRPHTVLCTAAPAAPAAQASALQAAAAAAAAAPRTRRCSRPPHSAPPAVRSPSSPCVSVLLLLFPNTTHHVTVVPVLVVHFPMLQMPSAATPTRANITHWTHHCGWSRPSRCTHTRNNSPCTAAPRR